MFRAKVLDTIRKSLHSFVLASYGEIPLISSTYLSITMPVHGHIPCLDHHSKANSWIRLSKSAWASIKIVSI